MNHPYPINTTVYALLTNQRGVSFWQEGVVRSFDATSYILDYTSGASQGGVPYDQVFLRLKPRDRVSILVMTSISMMGEIMKVSKRPSDGMPVYKIRITGQPVLIDIAADESWRLEQL